MKTPREILLAHHRATGPKLDALRRAALSSVKKSPPENSPISWRDLVRSLRWHLVGLSAVWLFIMFLNLDIHRAPAMLASAPPAKIPSPQIIMASLRENRRLLSEMIEPASFESEHRSQFLPKPRSERRVESAVV